LALTPDPEPGAPTAADVLAATPPVAPRTRVPDPVPEAAQEVATDAAEGTGQLRDRARQLLGLLRCPVTGEPLVEDPDGGLRSAVTGRRWPVVAGRPVLDPEGRAPVRHPDAHVGNPLPDRVRQLVASAEGPVLHLSGGGTAAGHGAVELDLDVYRPTDLVGDAHHLPFDDAVFDLVVAMNAFEHYRDPQRVADEIHRILRPGGLVAIHTAFLQPVHEAPHHYLNATRWGVEAWFRRFETLDLGVPDTMHPGYALAWLAADAEEGVRHGGGDGPADDLRATTLGRMADLWRDPSRRHDDPTWASLARLQGADRERLAAGFELIARRPR
jgi:SAM-dependent methyltransferase